MKQSNQASAMQHDEVASSGDQEAVELPATDEWFAGPKFREADHGTQAADTSGIRQAGESLQQRSSLSHEEWLAHRREQIARRSNEYYAERARVTSQKNRRALRLTLFMVAVIILSTVAFITPIALKAYPSSSLFGLIWPAQETRVASLGGSGSVYMTTQATEPERKLPDERSAETNSSFTPVIPEPEISRPAERSPVDVVSHERLNKGLVEATGQKAPDTDPGRPDKVATENPENPSLDGSPELPASKATAPPVSSTSEDRPRNKAADNDDKDQEATPKTQVIAALDLTAQEPSHASKSVKESRSTLTSDEARELLEHGDRLMQLGDIVSARSLYARALSADRANAALRLGSTYDPLIYERIGVRGLRADTAKALEWYLTAAKAGNANARQAHDALKTFNSQ